MVTDATMVGGAPLVDDKAKVLADALPDPAHREQQDGGGNRDEEPPNVRNGWKADMRDSGLNGSKWPLAEELLPEEGG